MAHSKTWLGWLGWPGLWLGGWLAWACIPNLLPSAEPLSPTEGLPSAEPPPDLASPPPESPSPILRLRSLTCSHWRSGQSVVCHIHGEGFLQSNKAWISCLQIDESQRLSDALWKMTGIWACGCLEPLRANLKGNLFDDLETSQKLDEEACYIAPEVCHSVGRECGKWVDPQGEEFFCGSCPGYTSCLEGRCQGATQFASRCEGREIWYLDARGNRETRKTVCIDACLSKEPFGYAVCRLGDAASFCTIRVDGAFCEGSELVTCHAKQVVRRDTCPWACKIGEAGLPDACLSLPQAGSRLVHHASGLCATPIGPWMKPWVGVELAPCQGSWKELWVKTPEGSLRHASGLCLGVEPTYDRRGNGYLVHLFACRDLSDVRWEEDNGGLRVGSRAYLVPYGVSGHQGSFLHLRTPKEEPLPSGYRWTLRP